MRQFPLARLAAVAAIGLFVASIVGGCSIVDRIRPGSKATSAKETASAEEIDVRRYIGPNYCPELRVYDGAQLIRTYERGHQGDQNSLKWQASIGKTARECLYDQQGGLTLKIGVSGRAVTGPKGDGDAITVPIKIAIVKYKESLITSESFSVSVSIPPQGSTVFRQVKEITVPSPGHERNYIIYVGFDVGGWDPMKPSGAAIAAAEPQPAEEPAPALVPDVEETPPPAQPPPPKAAASPDQLPTPTGGFVLSQ
jgi:hypothetical protein